MMEKQEVRLENKRYDYLDILRFLAILTVIMLHCISKYFVDVQIFGTASWKCINLISTLSRFGVPIFLMISGYLVLSKAKEARIGSFWKKKLKEIVLPFVIWSFIYYIVNLGVLKEAFSVKDFLFKFITMDIKYHLWFMYTLLILYLLVPIIGRGINSLSKAQLIYLLLVIIFPTGIAPAINKFSGVWLFRFDYLILGYAGYFILGYYLGKFEIKRLSRYIIYLGGIAGVLMGYFGTLKYSSAKGIESFFNYGNMINSYLIAMAVFVLIKNLFLERNILDKTFFRRSLAFMGRCSFEIYFVHVLVLEYLNVHLTIETWYLSIMVKAVVTFSVSFIVAAIIYVVKAKLRSLRKTRG